MTRLLTLGTAAMRVMMRSPTVLTTGQRSLRFITQSLPPVFERPGSLLLWYPPVSHLREGPTSWTRLFTRSTPNTRLSVIPSELRPYSRLNSSFCSSLRSGTSIKLFKAFEASWTTPSDDELTLTAVPIDFRIKSTSHPLSARPNSSSPFPGLRTVNPLSSRFHQTPPRAPQTQIKTVVGKQHIMMGGIVPGSETGNGLTLMMM